MTKTLGVMNEEIKNPKELTFSQLKEIIRLELLDLQSSGHIILGKDKEGKIQSYCIAVEIEDALREPIYG